jgi:hypothetical protein
LSIYLFNKAARNGSTDKLKRVSLWLASSNDSILKNLEILSPVAAEQIHGNLKPELDRISRFARILSPV